MNKYSGRQVGYLEELEKRIPKTKYCTDFLREEYESIKSDTDKREVLCDIISSELRENPNELSSKDRTLLESILNMSEIADNLYILQIFQMKKVLCVSCLIMLNSHIYLIPILEL